MINKFGLGWKHLAILGLFAVAMAAFSLTGHAVSVDDSMLPALGMVGSFYDKIANVQNVRPGGVAICELPCNVTYDKVKFKLGGGLTVADIERIEAKANGKTFLVTTGPREISRQKYKGIDTDTGYITVDFTEPKARGGAVPQFLASIPANLLSKLTFEVTIAAAANALSTMECHVEFRAPTQNPFIRKLVDFNFSAAAAGDHDMFLPAGSVGGIIKRVWFHGTDKMTGYELRVNGLTARRALKADWEFEQTENGLAPQATMDVLDFIADGNMQGALNTGPDAAGKTPTVALRATFSAAETLVGYIEYIDPIGRI